MNKDEMIEEMSKIIYKSDEKCVNAYCFECEYVNTDRCVYILGATELYNAGYRKVADDEIVIKKSKIGMLEKTIDYLEMEKAQLNKQLEQAEQEVSREILQELYDEAISYVCKTVELTAFQIEQLAKEKGVELEKDNE